MAATEAALPAYVVYRLKDLEAAKAEGQPPVIVFGNGGCANTFIAHEKVLSAASCRGAAKTGNSASNRMRDADANPITVAQDIRYREGNGPAWVLDLATPAARGHQRWPALVIVHGGGWGMGSASDPVYQKMMVDYALKR
ncbi:hypothetical protein [Hymenobacter volaticus]|uniref:Alpha/beta hydrolase n=1 Tax=Hymenobacter volaticus TaxID=2932254 RepID=A0ABY4GEF3_9BACT|nr:hypothetical protein [Hymenobacter volaticus]UOQ69136.1 hypothetical protein MUN86_25815 [Hymenobacter volaticus]